MPFALGPLAIVEGPGGGRSTEAGEGRLVEDLFKQLVAAAHPAVVARAFAGVAGGRHEPGVGGEVIGALEGTEVTHRHQELGAQECTHTGKTGEDLGEGMGEEAAFEFRVGPRYALPERERLGGEVGDDPGGDSSAGRRTLWPLAAATAFWARAAAPRTPLAFR